MTVNVFLADLQHSYFRYIRNSVPIGMGYVTAYLENIFGDQIRIYQLRKFHELCAALEQAKPNIVALGSYSWNTILTRKTAAYIRERFPDAVIAVGGPDASQVPSICHKDLESHPAIDFIMPNEGEAPTRNLVETMLSKSNPQSVREADISGCLALDRTTAKLVGTPITRFEFNINDIPSPYLGGQMDRFLNDPDYLPIIQTSRGCPYKCTFCVSGKDSWGKVKEFDLDRVKAEIDYVAEHAANPFLRFADENFGILHRDEEIAEYVMKKKENSIFPSAVSLYTDKHPTDRVKRISRIMRDVLPFCISFQSTTPQVLKNIKRINLTDKAVESATDFARANDLILVTELIFGMPGETIESFLDSINHLIDHRFSSIAIHMLRILKGTEMDVSEDRERFRVKTMFGMSENGFTKHSEMESIELDEWVVENDTMSQEEYFNFSKFIFLFMFGIHRTYFRELLFFFESLGIKLTDVLLHVLENPKLYPILCEKSNEASLKRREMLFPTQQGVVDYISEKMACRNSDIEGVYRFEETIIIEFFLGNHLQQAVDEIACSGRNLFIKKFGEPTSEFDEQLELIKKVVIDCFIPLDQPSQEVKSISSNYDLAAWTANHYLKPLSDYRVPTLQNSKLKIRNYSAYQIIWNNDDTLFERHKRQFSTINNAGLRRTII